MDLFTLAPHSDADTSRAAAKAIVPHLERLEARVLDYLRSQGDFGATAEQIGESLNMAGSTVRPRLVALRAQRANRGPLVCDSGKRRRTRSGRAAIVWEIVP